MSGAAEKRESVPVLCTWLSAHVVSIALLVTQRAPWRKVEPLLSAAHGAIEKLAEAYNDFERAVERQYEAEIAAAEKEP